MHATSTRLLAPRHLSIGLTISTAVLLLAPTAQARDPVCDSDPWSLSNPTETCSPLMVVETSAVSGVDTWIWTPDEDFPHRRMAVVTWTTPKILDDHDGHYDTFHVFLTIHRQHPDSEILEIWRNSQGIGWIARDGDQETSNLPATYEVKSTMAFYQRDEIQGRFLQSVRYMVGDFQVEAGGPMCKRCKRKTVIFGALYAGIGIVCCVGSGGAFCAGCAAGALASGTVAVGALSEACDTRCAEEECEAAYDECKRRRGQTPPSRTLNEGVPQSAPDDDCKQDYDFCMSRARM